MAMTTCGHPKAAAGWKWTHSAIEGKQRDLIFILYQFLYFFILYSYTGQDSLFILTL